MNIEIIGNRYKLLNNIGGGVNTTVYRAHDLCTDERVALKLLLDKGKQQKIDFEGEYLLMQDIDHPFYPKVIDFGLDHGGLPFFTMEYVSGLDLREIFVGERTLEKLPDLLYSICLALRCLHQRGILHCDLKPENVKVEKTYDVALIPGVKILDLGLARPFFSGEKRQISGTVNYIAPEIIQGGRVDNKADIYSLGISLYESLSGKPPYEGKKVDIVQQIISDDIPSINSIRNDIDPYLAELIDSMTAVRPSDRPSGVEEIIGCLESKMSIDGSIWREALFTSPTIGKERETIENLISSAGEEKGREGVRLSFVVGSEGVGKTFLANRLRTRFQLSGFKIYCADGKQTDGPFHSFSKVIREIDPGGISGEEESGDSILINYEEIDHKISLLIDKMKNERVAFLLDNIEDIDTHSLIAIRLLLIGLSSASPCCVVVLGENAAEALEAEDYSNIIGLDSLMLGIKSSICSIETVKIQRWSTDNLKELIRGYLGEIPRGLDELAEELYAMTGGCPGLTKELLPVLHNKGLLHFSGGEWDVNVDGVREINLQEYSDSQLFIESTDLSDEEEQIFMCASVLGDEFKLADLKGLLDDGDPGELDVLNKLLDRNKPLTGTEKGAIRFKNRMLRESFYEKLEKEEKINYHRKALSIIKSRGDDNPISLARHYFGAGESEKGIPCLKAAVERCKEIGKWSEALNHLKRLKVWVRGNKDEEFWVEREMGDIQFELRSFTEAVGAYRESLAIAKNDTQFDKRELEVLVRLARSLIKINSLDEASETLTRTGDRIGWEKNNPLTGKVQREIGWIHYQRGQYKSALRLYRRSLSVSRHSKDLSNTLHLYNDLAVLYQGMSRWQKADWWVGKAVKEGLNAGDRVVVANSRSIQGQGFRKRGDYKKAEIRYTEALDLYREQRDYFGMSQTFNNISELHRERGELEQAVKYQKKSLYLKEFLRNDIGVAYSLSNLGLAYRAMGDLERSIELFKRSAEIRISVGDRDGVGKVYGYLAETLIELERWDETRKVLELMDEQLEMSESSYYSQFKGYIEGLLDLRKGSFYRAAKKLTMAARSFQELGFADDESRARKDLGWALFEQGNIGDSQREGLDALKTARSIGHRELTVECLLVVARALESMGGEDNAAHHYSEVLELLEDTNFKPLRARALLACAEHLYRNGAWKWWGKGASKFDSCVSEAVALFEEMGIREKAKEARSLQEMVSKEIKEIGGRELFTLYEAGQVINSSLEIDVVLDRLMDMIVQTMDVERSVIFLKDAVTGELTMEVARNVEKETIEEAKTFSSTILHDVQKQGKPIFIPDCREDELCQESKSISRYSILSVICVPLRQKGEIIGTIYVDDCRTTHLFHQSDVDFLVSLGGMAAMAIQNAHLFQQLETANRRLEEEARDLRRQVRTKNEFQGIVGRHESMNILYQVIEKVAQTDASVLIRGENGSGKELVARAIHYLSERKEKPFIVVNCAAIPEALLESELFGIEKGTATGVERRVGKFEQADGGTLLLDEIGDMSPSIQAKLLRILQEKRFQRLGGRQNIAVDIKILSATNKNLEKAIEEGWFREDLYYRLNALPVFVPPLIERIEDLPILIEHFLRRWSEENDRSLPSLSRPVMKILSEYSWPGNVRQLKNVVERMALLCSGGVLGVEDLPPEILARNGAERKPSGEIKNLREFVWEYVWKVYLESGKNKKKACETLGITYKTLQSYLSKKLE
jgi:Nif-specific regulatory protein